MPPNYPLLILVPLALASCTTPDFVDRDTHHHTKPRATPLDAPGDGGFSYWRGWTASGPASITIDLSDQAAYFYKGNTLVGRARVATGKTGNSTPTGNFKISEKKINKESNLYGTTRDRQGRAVNSNADTRRHSAPAGGYFDGADMPYWMRFNSSSIGMHAGPIPDAGNPASHGCVRLPPHMARLFYNDAPPGTPVRIKN
ncbi:MAG: L,D-transpeptidase [Verrucomicrobiales bacterium]|nr:L,D-transpeptidase [Verrucomicrobiales bacterium]